MKSNDLVLIGAAALATATLTVAFLLPTSIEAGGEGEGLAPKIAQPKLVSQGVEITLARENDQPLKAGDEPSFVLKFLNLTNLPAELRVRVAMSSTTPAAAWSRMMPRPSQLWEHWETTTLKPNETKTVTLATSTKLPTNSTINVFLQVVDPKAPALAANAPGAPVGQQPVVVNITSAPAPAVPTSDAGAVAGPVIRSGPIFLPGLSAIVALSFSTATTPTQTPWVVSAQP